jgi:hypothetical protein
MLKRRVRGCVLGLLFVISRTSHHPLSASGECALREHGDSSTAAFPLKMAPQTDATGVRVVCGTKKANALPSAFFEPLLDAAIWHQMAQIGGAEAFGRPFTQEQAVSLRTHVRSPPARFALTHATNDAVRLLKRGGCARVFADFTDKFGRTLQHTLDALGESPVSYLGQLTFREGSDGRCKNSSVLAYTTVGEKDVFICSTQFVEQMHRSPLYIAALIIHEMLHSLGLGENPPSSLEITGRVLRHCR